MSVPTPSEGEGSLPDAAAILSKPFEQLGEGEMFLTPSRTVTEADIVSFAGLTGDLSPQHIDADWAASSAFGERVAQGALVLSCALGLMYCESMQATALMGISDVMFTRPVRIGDQISARGRISALLPKDPETGVVSITLLTVNQHRKTVCRARIRFKWRRHLSTSQSTKESA